MIGTKEICALLLAGGMGAGSVVAVQKAKPAISKPRPAASKPKVQKAVQTQTQTASITECPTVGPVGSADLSPMIAMETTEPLTGFRETATGPLGGGGIGGGGGGGGGGGDLYSGAVAGARTSEVAAGGADFNSRTRAPMSWSKLPAASGLRPSR